MTRHIFLPYRLPRPGRFESSEWELSIAGEPRPLPSVLEGWDFYTDLTVSVRLATDLRGALADCGLPSHAPLVALIAWRSSRTGLRGHSEPALLTHGTNQLAAQLPGVELGGHLEVQARVALGAVVEAGPLCPRRPGSTVWSEGRSIALEGVADRFPVEVRNFQKAGLFGPQAAWVLHWDSDDPEAAASAAIRLWLNSAHPAAADLAKGSPGDPTLLSFLIYDVTRQLVDKALESDYFSDDVDWPNGSLGAALIQRVRSVFRGLSFDECRALRRHHPDDYESAIQSATGLLTRDR